MPQISSTPMQAKSIPELPTQAAILTRPPSPGPSGDGNHTERHEEFPPVRQGYGGRPALCVEDHLRRIAIALKGLPQSSWVLLDAGTKTALLNPPEVLVPFWPWQRHRIAAEGTQPIIDYLTLLSRVNAPAIPAVRQFLAQCRQLLAEPGHSSRYEHASSQRIAACLDTMLAPHLSNQPLRFALAILTPRTGSPESSPEQRPGSARSAQTIPVTCVIDNRSCPLASGQASGADPEKWMTDRLAQKLFEKCHLANNGRQQRVIERLTSELHAKGEMGAAMSRMRTILEDSGISLVNPRLAFTLTFPENQESGKISAINVDACLSCEGYRIGAGKSNDGKERKYHALQPDGSDPLCRIHVKSTLAWSRDSLAWKTAEHGMAAHLASKSAGVCKDFSERLIHLQKELQDKAKSQVPAPAKRKDPAQDKSAG